MKKRVKIPKNSPSLVLELARRVHKKHLEDGDSSVLRALNWETLGPVIDEAIAEQRN